MSKKQPPQVYREQLGRVKKDTEDDLKEKVIQKTESSKQYLLSKVKFGEGLAVYGGEGADYLGQLEQKKES
ncbi:MAG TPA: hypothetical protein GXX38_07955 [Clostridia bacterium]|jgi:hypothetical protein|nr:hypothetical protein [Clostridia bacterium]